MDTSQFKKLEHPADFRALERYVDCIDPTLVKLKRVVQPYYLRTLMRCSLTTCHQEHLDGVLVELEDGRFSNIGHVCGSRPENFGEQLTREMQFFGEAQVRRDAILRLQDRATIKARFDAILLLRRQHYLWQARIDTFLASFKLSQYLQSRGRQAGGHAVVEERERTEEEIDRLLSEGTFQSRAQARYYQIARGEIIGLNAANVRIPIEDLYENADRLRLMDPLSLSTRDLLSNVRMLESLSTGIQSAARWLADAQRFLTPANFAVLAYLPISSDERNRLATLTLDKIDAVIPRSTVPERRTTVSPTGSARSKQARQHERRLEAQMRAAKRPLFIEK
jgi:hypothetical protein